MMVKGVKLLMLGVALTMLAVTVQQVRSGAPQDPLAEWAYPKAKRGMEGTNQPPLVWSKFTTTDPFEKVWDFYWQKVVKGAPMSLPPSAKSGTLYSGPPKDQTVCAHFRDDNPDAKVGVFVVREKNRTISITILRRAKEKETIIIVAVDKR